MFSRTTRLLSVICLLTASNLQAADKYALLVGVTAYEDASMNNSALKYPEADATAMAKMLRSSGYTVDLLLGKKATLAEVSVALKKASGEGTAEGVVMIGLFGHGVQYQSDAYYAPYDTRVRIVTDRDGNTIREASGKPKLEPNPETMVSMRMLLDTLTVSPAGNKVLVADCCREDPSAARGRAFGSQLKVSDLPTSTAALFACSEREQAFEHDDWGHGAFTSALLQHSAEMASEGRVMAGSLSDQVYLSVRDMVASKTKGAATQRVNPIINGIVDLKLTGAIAEKSDTSRMRADEPISPAPLTTPKLSPRNVITNSIGMRLVSIPAGTFTMGSPESEGGRADDERRYEVTLSKSYYLGRFEVTQDQWEQVMGTQPWKGNEHVNVGRGCAAGNVSWEDAVEFCKRLSELPEEKRAGRVYRLPTEAEWEYACRAGSKTAYSFGDSSSLLGTYARFQGNKYSQTGAVGLKNSNAWGLYDMHGNVWEWCSDWYAYYPRGSEMDPTGPRSGSLRVLRGGSWSDEAADCRSASRGRGFQSWQRPIIGFRVALSSSGIPE